MDKDQTTTPGTTRPTLYDECVGTLTSPANQQNEDAGDGALVVTKKEQHKKKLPNSLILIFLL